MSLLEQGEEDGTCVMVAPESKSSYQIIRRILLESGAEDLSEAYYLGPTMGGLFFRIGRWLYKRRFGWGEGKLITLVCA